MSIESAPVYIRKAYGLMVEGCTARQMATQLSVGLKTAENYRNRVNRIVGHRRPWEPTNPKRGSFHAVSVGSEAEVRAGNGEGKEGA